MSAINLTTESPASIASIEQAIAWLATLAYTLHKGETYKEANGSSIDSGLAPLADISFVTAADGTERMIARFAIEMDPAHYTDTSAKIWQFAQAWSSTSVPPAFKVD